MPEKQFGEKDHGQTITIVSGLPRSGTSLMMSMLSVGGLEILTDNLRESDEDNPEGYYEMEEVKKLIQGEHAWVPRARGKVVKVISTLLPYLPGGYNYRIVFMHREMKEVLASQKKMLINRGDNPDKVSDELMAMVFEKNLQQVEGWIAAQPHVVRLDVNYNRLIGEPRLNVTQINTFMGGGLDEEKMLGVINPDLYRQRFTS